MKPILFSIFGFNIYSYGLMMALALIGSIFFAQQYGKKKGLDGDFIFNLGFYAVIMGVIGSKILYFITIFDQLINDFWGTLKVSITEGFVVYGGIILAVIFSYFYCRKHNKPFLTYFDVAAPAIALGQGIGRIGCFLSGCCYGKETSSWFSVVFPEGSHAPSGVKLFPSQPLSAFLDILNVAILVYAGRKFKNKGRVCALYMINYGIGRFVIEFFRNDFRGEVGPFSTSQFISLFVTLLGVLFMYFAPKSKENKTETVNTGSEENFAEESESKISEETTESNTEEPIEETKIEEESDN